MTDRACIRGCVKRGEHFAACESYGKPAEEATCRGCVPVPARGGALICDRDFRRLRRVLDDAPDLIGLLRSKADPMGSSWNWDREIVSGSRRDLAPAPVAADLIDAADQLMGLLWTWGTWASAGEVLGRRWLKPGIDAPTAHGEALEAATALLERLDDLANDAANIELLCGWTIARWWPEDVAHDVPEEDRRWTLARALERWPLVERPWMAAQPCPWCDLRAIRVFPARTAAGRTRFVCQSEVCEFERDDSDVDADWALMFSKRMGVPGFIPEGALIDD